MAWLIAIRKSWRKMGSTTCTPPPSRPPTYWYDSPPPDEMVCVINYATASIPIQVEKVHARRAQELLRIC